MTEAVPAFVTLIMIVFTYSIGNRLTAGLILYPVLKVASGRGRDGRGVDVGGGVTQADAWRSAFSAPASASP